MIIKIILFTLLSLSVLNISDGQSLSTKAPKMNGVNFIGPATSSIKLPMIQAVKVINATWISFVPTAIVDRSTLKLRPDSTHHIWAETKAGVEVSLQLAKQTNLKIMIKPHIFLEQLSAMDKSKFDLTQAAIWRGDFIARNEEAWEVFEESYREYILDLVQMANKYQVDLFCIGTELREFVQQRPKFWSTLIKDIRSIYTGKLTYSANWDEYSLVPFWTELDYIGIDAYFPISMNRTPSEAKAFAKWVSIKFNIKTISNALNKQVIFTEYGYRNVDFAGKEPWTHDKGMDTPNTAAQVNLYRALYSTFWDEEWVAGGFLWTWNYKATSNGSTDFNINNKAVMSVVRDWYR